MAKESIKLQMVTLLRVGLVTGAILARTVAQILKKVDFKVVCS